MRNSKVFNYSLALNIAKPDNKQSLKWMELIEL